MKSRFLLLTILCFVFFTSCKTDGSSSEYQTSPNEITWLSLDQAEGLKNTEKKKYFIDLYTSWCGWCRVMDNNTFTDPEVIKYMQTTFHSVKFDAEQKDKAILGGKEYGWAAGGRNGVNQLTVDLLDGDLSYPSFVVLDENKKRIKIFKGFLEAESFLQVIKSVD